MRYLGIGISILALLLSFCCLTAYCSARFLEEIAEPLRAMSLYFDAEHYAAMLVLIEESRALWDDRYGYFSCILDHSELETVEQCYASLASYAEQQELAELRDAHTRLLSMLEHLRATDRPTYYNILFRLS